jgi:hypothetical protein
MLKDSVPCPSPNEKAAPQRPFSADDNTQAPLPHNSQVGLQAPCRMRRPIAVAQMPRFCHRAAVLRGNATRRAVLKKGIGPWQTERIVLLQEESVQGAPALAGSRV